MYVSDKEMTIIRTYIKAIVTAFREENSMDLVQLLDMFMADDRLHRCARDVLMMIYEYMEN